MNVARIGSILMMVLVIPAIAQGDQAAYELDGAGLEARGQLKNLKYYPEDEVIRLNDMYLLEDDAPGNGPPKGVEDRAWVEKLHEGIKIRKEFILDDPRAFSGYLVFDGFEKEQNEHPLHISINGVHVVRLATKYASPYSEHYYIIGKHNYFTDNWFVVEIPVGALRAGKNECVLWTETEETSWEMVIAVEEEYIRGSATRTHHPNRSAKSRDGGVTWDDEHLGWKDEIDGEYGIRLSLDRFVPTGTYISPVLDLAQDRNDSIKRLLDIKECRLTWDIDIPDGTRALIKMRLGSNPVPGTDAWDDFHAVDGLSAVLTNPGKRYLQFVIEFSSENPLATPSLKGFTVQTSAEDAAPVSNVFMRMVEFNNGRVLRPSIDFIHEDFEKMKDFRTRFELDKLVEGCATEFERQLRLLRFAYEIPIERFDPYNWDYHNVPVLMRDEDGAIVRQKNYEGRRRDHHCLFSNFTLMGACIAMGYPARYVNLQTEGRQHAHEVMEVWSNDFNKWVFLDATRDNYIYDPETGIPLSLTEINERLAEIVPRPATWRYPIWWQIPDETEAYRVKVAYREGTNRYSIKDVDQGPHILFLKGQLHQVIRNDFASRPELVPWRVSGHWGGNQFYGFYSDIFPRKREYGINTNRIQDFNFTLNQAELTMSETGLPGVIRVDVDTETPCFETFLVCMDDGAWKKNQGSSFDWQLHEGINRVRVRVQNTAGALGPVSFVSVMMNN